MKEIPRTEEGSLPDGSSVNEHVHKHCVWDTLERRFAKNIHHSTTGELMLFFMNQVEQCAILSA